MGNSEPESSHVPRLRIDLNNGWQFVRRRAGRDWLAGQNDSDGRVVDLPHCWNEQDAFRDGIEYYRGWGSYRRTVRVPCGPGDRVWIVETEGFYGTGDAWTDGARSARINGRFLGTRIELGGDAVAGRDCRIGIRLTNRCPRHVLPGVPMPDFLLYGGLSGRASLLGLPQLHVDSGNLRIDSELRATGESRVTIRFTIVNRSTRTRSCTVQWSIENRDGEQVARAPELGIELDPGQTVRDREVVAALPGARAWSPDSPCLYRASCRVIEAGNLLDRFSRRFGLRTTEFRPAEGFFLNGRRLELHGCNRHESMPGFGRALPAQQHRRDAELLKEYGCNFVRLSHYPQHPAFLDACDELGILVYAEIATWKGVRGGRWLVSACRQMRDMIRRDRHHPCVVLWGLANEGRLRRVFLRLRDIVRREDPGRAVIYAENHLHRARRRRTLGIPDVWGLNYELDELEEARDAARLRNVVVSECSNEPHTRRGDPEAETRQLDRIKKDLAVLRPKPYVAGFALWNFNDYATLRKKRYARHSGIMDAWRVPKLSAWLMRAMYAEEPFVSLHGRWGACRDDGLNGEKRPCRIHVFTNCDRVVLEQQGQQALELRDGRHFVRELPFTDSDLVATGFHGSGRVEDRLRPYGQAASLAIEFDPYSGDEADCRTLGLSVRVLDRRGVAVPDWSGEVSIKVDGPARLRSHLPSGNVIVAGGTGRAFLSSTGDQGRIEVRAGHPRLEPGCASLQLREEERPPDGRQDERC